MQTTSTGAERGIRAALPQEERAPLRQRMEARKRAKESTQLERARNQGIFIDIAGLGATSVLDRST